MTNKLDLLRDEIIESFRRSCVMYDAGDIAEMHREMKRLLLFSEEIVRNDDEPFLEIRNTCGEYANRAAAAGHWDVRNAYENCSKWINAALSQRKQ